MTPNTLTLLVLKRPSGLFCHKSQCHLKKGVGGILTENSRVNFNRAPIRFLLIIGI